MKQLLLMVSFWCISACTMLPHTSLDIDKKAKHEQSDANFDIHQMATVFPITPNLLNQLKGHREAQLNKIRQANLNTNRDAYIYRLDSGDVLTIRVFNQPELNSSVNSSSTGGKQVNDGTWVDETGHIFYPLVGKIYVRGKSIAQTRDILMKRLAQYLKNPQLDINISDFRSQNVYINGAVKSTTTLPLTNVPMTLLDAINRAGGFSDNADTNHIKLTTKRGKEYTISLQDILKHSNIKQNRLLQNGDVIYVPPKEDTKVYVMGETLRQKIVYFGNNGLNLTETIAQAEGLNQITANATGVFVIRQEKEVSPDKPIHIFQLNLSDASAYVLGTDFQLKPNDVVYVTTAPVTLWNRVLSQIMPSVSGISAVENLINN